MLDGGFGLWMILLWICGLLLVVLIDAIRESCQDRPDWDNLSKALEGKPASESNLSPARDLFGSPVSQVPLTEAVPETTSSAAGRWSRRGIQQRRPKPHAPTRTCKAGA